MEKNDGMTGGVDQHLDVLFPDGDLKSENDRLKAQIETLREALQEARRVLSAVYDELHIRDAKLALEFIDDALEPSS